MNTTADQPDGPRTTRTTADQGTDLDAATVAGLKAGDEAAFAELYARVDPMLRRLARTYVAHDSVAEEAVQETWLAVINGIERFEGRSSLVTWIAAILTNQASRHGVREKRTVPFAELAADGPSVDPDRFQTSDDVWPGHWATPPRPWQSPERRLLSLEVRERIRDAMDEMPERQRLVLGLRDVDGCSSDEVCELLDLSAENQRVLLHRGRSRLRDLLDGYIEEA